MATDYSQRRRIAIACAITVIAIPAALLLDRDTTNTDPVTETVGVSPNSLAAAPTADSDPGEPTPLGTDPMGSSPAVFLDPNFTPTPRDPPTIAVPSRPQAERGSAGFSRSIRDITTCEVASAIGAPFRSEITVTNLDNRRSVRCVYTISDDDESVTDVVLHPDAFAQIANLTDAPILVELSW